METRTEVKTVQVDYKCPRCGVGYLRPTGIVHPTNPPQIPHRCNSKTGCDYGESIMGFSYPYIDYEEKKDLK